MKNLKRMLSLLVVLAMAMSMSAFAADFYVDNADDDAFSTIAEALTAAAGSTDEADTIHVAAGTYELQASAALEANMTLTGAGEDATTLTIVPTAGGNGIVLYQPNITISDVTLDGSQLTGSSWYNAAVTVAGNADGAEFSHVALHNNGGASLGFFIGANDGVNKGGPSADDTITFSDCDLSGRLGKAIVVYGGSLVIEDSEIDATYPFNVDGGNGGTVEVTDSELHGWTSYGTGTKSATFTNTEFSLGDSGYNAVAAYADTTFDNCTFNTPFKLYAGTTGFTWNLYDSEKDGTPITSKDDLPDLFADDWVWEKCTVNVSYTAPAVEGPAGEAGSDALDIVIIDSAEADIAEEETPLAALPEDAADLTIEDVIALAAEYAIVEEDAESLTRAELVETLYRLAEASGIDVNGYDTALQWAIDSGLIAASDVLEGTLTQEQLTEIMQLFYALFIGA